MMRWRGNAFNIVVATLVTVVLWTFAAEKTRTQAQSSGQVVVQVPAGSLLYVDPPDPFPVNVKLTGSHQSIRKFEAALAGTLVLTPAILGVPNAPGEATVDLQSAIARTPQALEGDIVLESVAPAQLLVRLGELVMVPARVSTNLPLAQIAGEASIDPPEVTVVLPREASDSISELHLDADVSVRNLEAGRRHSIDAELRLPEALNRWRDFVRIAPSRARVVFTLRSNMRNWTIPVVPVQISGPPEDLANYDIRLQPSAGFLRDVEVSGPADAISQIELGRVAVAALVHLSADDLARRVESVPVALWLLPKGVSVSRVGGSGDTAPLIALKIELAHP
ncbi:MAG: YbbR-like domain-containing protein [Phycisphaerales bacterium]|nr:YbbR-like domain-containing protein [Phycisphaerales bacterium]